MYIVLLSHMAVMRNLVLGILYQDFFLGWRWDERVEITGMAEQSRHDKGSHTLVAALPPRLLLSVPWLLMLPHQPQWKDPICT